MPQFKGSNIEDLSEISMGHHRMSSGLMSGHPSILLMEDISKNEGAFLSELNLAFARKMSSNQPEEEKQQQPPQQQPQPPQKYEMVKKPLPTATKRLQQPPSKH